jgi:hypothetical protein
MGPEILKRFYSCTIESILTGCITAWYGNCSASDRKALQSVVRMAQYITGATLPAIQELSTRWCQRKALKIVKDPSHPSHKLFSLLRMKSSAIVPSLGQKRLLNSFYPQAIRLLNTHHTPTPLLRYCYSLVIIYAYSFQPYLHVHTTSINLINRCLYVAPLLL